MAGNSIVFTDNLDEVLSALNSAIESGLVKIGAAAQGYAKDNTPVRTGTLRDSIGVINSLKSRLVSMWNWAQEADLAYICSNEPPRSTQTNISVSWKMQ